MVSFTLPVKDYKLIVEQVPVMIWRANTSAKYDFFNEKWLAFTGRAMEQEIGHGWSESVHPEDLDRYYEIFLDALNKQTIFETEYRLRRYDNLFRWIHVKGMPFHSTAGSFAGYVGIAIDITDMIWMREAVKDTKKCEIIRCGRLLPICAGCQRIRDEKGYWYNAEIYLMEHSEFDLTYGICPDCMKKLYP
jgi:PAS domain S-box-containing protein